MFNKPLGDRLLTSNDDGHRKKCVFLTFNLKFRETPKHGDKEK